MARRFQSDPAVVGRQISLAMPACDRRRDRSRFDTEQFEPQPDVWVPFQIDPLRIDGGNLFTVTGRLTPQTSLASANAQLAVAIADYRRSAPGRAALE